MKKLLLILILLLIPTVAEATTWYVGKSTSGGSDSNSCTTAQTITTPKLTIAAGIACVTTNGSLGHTLYIKAGTYTEQINSSSQTIPAGTSWPNAPRIAANPGDVVTINPSGSDLIALSNPAIKYLIFDGIIVDGTNGSGNGIGITSGVNHVRFQNMEVKNTARNGVLITPGTGGTEFHEFINVKVHNTGTSGGGHGMYISTANNLIEYGTIYDNAKYGLHVYEGTGVGVNNNIVRRNLVYGNDNPVGSPSGIIIDAGTGNIAHNNIVYGNTYGITIGGSSTSNKAYNNTVYGNTAAGINTGSSTGAQIKNNIFYNNGTNLTNAGSGTVISNNLCGGTGGSTNCAITANPGFGDPTTGNFSLTSNASPAANVGVDLGAGFPFNGSAPDVGAHETLPFSSVTMTDIIAPGVDNLMVINIANGVFPPLLPLTGCLGFTAKRNGAPNSITACARTGTNQITLTLQDAYVNTDSASFSYAPGNVTDSALIGNLKNQRLNAITDQVAITTGLTGGTPPPVSSLTQLTSRFECYGGPETAPDCSYPANTPLTLPPNSCTRLRVLLSNGATAQSSSGYIPYGSRNGVAYTAIPNGPCTSTGICFSAGTGTPPPELTAGTPTTEQLAGPGAFIAGGVQLSFSETPDVALLINQDTEFLGVFCIGAGNSAGDTFDIRWRKAGGIVLDAYTQTPRIVIGGGRTQEGSR